MQLQQLRYLVTAAQCGSFRAAAQKLYVSQSSISAAVKDLEDEMNTTAFERTRRGIKVTDEGAELIGYAKRVLREANAMATRYAESDEAATKLVVSSLHLLLVTRAFGDFLDKHDGESCNFELHETDVDQVIRDTSEGASDLGVIYKSNFTDGAVDHALDQSGLSFTPLFSARPFVVVGDEHPLAGSESVAPEELAPYDRYELEQGFETSPFYESEPISAIPHRRKIVLGDNSSLAALLAEHEGYAVATGLSPANRSLSLVPLESDERMTVGLVRTRHRRRTPAIVEFEMLLGRRVIAAAGTIEPSPEVHDLARVKRRADSR